MSHVRKQLRDAVVAALTGLASTGARVVRSRAYAGQITDQTLIVSISEEAEVDGFDQPTIVLRRFTITVDAVAKGPASGPDALDDSSGVEVEVALGSPLSIGGRQVTLLFQGSDYAFQTDGDQPAGILSMTFVATLSTTANAPSSLM